MDPLLITGGAAAALGLAALLLQGRRALLWFAFLLAFVPIEYIDRYHFSLPSLVKWAPLLGMLLAGVFSALVLPHVRTRVPRRVVVAVAAIVAAAAVSMAANDTAPVAFAVAQKGWIAAAGMVVALKAAYGVLQRHGLHAALVWVGMLSSLVSAVQRLVVVPNAPGPDAADRVTGLFSVGYLQLFFHLFCIGVVLSYQLRGRRVVSIPSPCVLLVLVGSLAVGNEKASLPYLLALVLFVVWRTGIREVLREHMRLVLGLPAVLALLFFGYSAINEQDGTEPGVDYWAVVLDPEYVRRYFFGSSDTRLTSGGELRRGAAVMLVWEEISDDPMQLSLGLGPGETADSRVPGATGSLALQYPGYRINRISLAMVLGDGGLLGILLFAAFFWSVWSARDRGDPPEHDRVREVFVFLAVAFTPYANLTNEAVYCLLLAVVLYPGREREPA